MRLGDLDALRKNMEFICMGIMAGTEPYNAPLTEIDNTQTIVNEYTKGFADGERSGRHFPLTDEEKAILVKQWQPKGEWIPVSERLPDFWEVVLVTDESGKVFEYERRPLDDDENECREWSFLGRKIIAWMPEPEPYKEGETK